MTAPLVPLATTLTSASALVRCPTCGTLVPGDRHPACDPVQVIRHRAHLAVLAAYFNRLPRL